MLLKVVATTVEKKMFRENLAKFFMVCTKAHFCILITFSQKLLPTKKEKKTFLLTLWKLLIQQFFGKEGEKIVLTNTGGTAVFNGLRVLGILLKVQRNFPNN